MTNYVLDARTATPHFPGIGRYVTNLAAALAPLLASDERLTILHHPDHPPALPDSPAVTLCRSVSRRLRSPSSGRSRACCAALRAGAGAGVRIEKSEVRSEGAVAPSFVTPSPVPHPRPLPQRLQPDAVCARRADRPDPLRSHSAADAGAEQRPGAPAGALANVLALRAARVALAISEATRRDYLAHFRVPAERIVTAPLAADPAFRPQSDAAVAALRARLALPERYVLYLGSNKPHKNLVGLVEAWHIAHSKSANQQISESANHASASRITFHASRFTHHVSSSPARGTTAIPRQSSAWPRWSSATA